jgi:protease-4
MTLWTSIGSMFRRHSLLRGVGILFIAVLVLFVSVFFFTYFTGGETRLLTLFGSDGVGVVMLEGTINESRGTIQSLKQFGDSERIKGVVVRINSPGGGVVPTQEIYEEIGKLKKKKPVFASLGGMATSGGYYIASACHRIVANPGTLTGSIGVIIQLANMEGLMQKLGLEGYNVKSGPYKDIGSPLRPLSPEGEAILQSVVDNVHGQFVRAVASGRSMEESRVRELADGRIYSGEQAMELGLVDSLGNMDDAIDLVSKRAGIEGVPQVIYSRVREKSWWERLLFSVFSEQIEMGRNWGLRYQ